MTNTSMNVRLLDYIYNEYVYISNVAAGEGRAHFNSW